ncbi:ABC transporter permease [Lacisediminihabitans profunda]|uniref:ABC transporter permease subunit n=1 Tax=Lacisediminihabitans profunda TaxID=2594790 RepID=A0A5C8UM62_9MICO|nr:ABC transporter permease subunit [Lacisediminihabitans profunda]TXN28911.1 ABC transporter permease subunit [Lacisediminihabitans profunda]
MTAVAAPLSSRGPVRLRLPQKARSGLLVLAGLAVLLGAWIIAAGTVGASAKIIPQPWTVVHALFADGFYGQSLTGTWWEAIRGFFFGNVAAVVAGATCILWPRLRGFIMQLAAATYSAPAVAIGPILIVFVDPDTTKVVISALSVFFVSASGILLGLSSASASSLELIHAMGGNTLFGLRKVRLRFAVPAAAAGIALSAPGALLGAIVAEYLGGDSGIGVAMVQAQQAFEVPRTWALALLATLISAAGYIVVSLIARRFSFEMINNDAAVGRAAPRLKRYGWRRTGIPVGKVAAGVVIVCAVWYALIWALRLDSYLAKTPGDILAFLTVSEGAAEHRSIIFGALGITLRDALAGYLVGSAVAIVAAISIQFSTVIEAMFMPIAMTLRSIPLVALTPLVGLVFGRDLIGVAVLTATITFVPTLVNLTVGMKQMPRSAEDLLHAYGLGWRQAVAVRTMFALPSLVTSARIAIPGAILGAVLAEYLATATGLGHLIALSSANSDFSTLWAAVTVTTVLSVVFYALLSRLESAAVRRLSP